MILLGFLFYMFAHHNITLQTIHINSVDDNWAEAISRSQVDKFLASCPMASSSSIACDTSSLTTLQVKAHKYFAGGLANSSHCTYNFPGILSGPSPCL